MDEDRSYQKIKSPDDQIRYEFTNQDTIVLRASGVYYKAVGNSAIILKIFGAKTKIRSRFSSTYGQEVLEISLHSSKIVETKSYLSSVSARVLRDDQLFYIVRLKDPVSAKRINRARKSPELRTEVTTDIILKTRQNTPIAKEVRDIFKETGLLVRAMRNQDGIVLGRALLEEAIGLQRIVRILMRTEYPSSELKVSVSDVTDNFLGLLLLVPNFADQSARLAHIARSVGTIRNTVAKMD